MKVISILLPLSLIFFSCKEKKENTNHIDTLSSKNYDTLIVSGAKGQTIESNSSTHKTVLNWSIKYQKTNEFLPADKYGVYFMDSINNISLRLNGFTDTNSFYPLKIRGEGLFFVKKDFSKGYYSLVLNKDTVKTDIYLDCEEHDLILMRNYPNQDSIYCYPCKGELSLQNISIIHF